MEQHPSSLQRTPAPPNGRHPLPPWAPRAEDEHGLRVLAYELTVAEARERQRIGSALHDELGQLLALIQLKLGELGQQLPEDRGPEHPYEELRALVTEASLATRLATFELHSPVLQRLGIDAALQGLVQRLQRLQRGRHTQLQLEGQLGSLALPEPVQAVLLRIVRELCLNALKHAQAQLLQLRLMRTAQRLCIEVQDDGLGFSPAALPPGFGPSGGFGLYSAQAQMQALGGSLRLHSAPGAGTLARLTLDLDRQE